MTKLLSALILCATAVAQNPRGGTQIVRVSQLNNHTAVQGRGAQILWDYMSVDGVLGNWTAVNLTDGTLFTINPANNSFTYTPYGEWGTGSLGSPGGAAQAVPYIADVSKYIIPADGFSLVVSRRQMGNDASQGGGPGKSDNTNHFAVLSGTVSGKTYLWNGATGTSGGNRETDSQLVTAQAKHSVMSWVYLPNRWGKSLEGAVPTTYRDVFIPTANGGDWGTMGLCGGSPGASCSASAGGTYDNVYANYLGFWNISLSDRDIAANARAITKLAMTRGQMAQDYSGTIAFIGDSITAGTALPSDWTGKWGVQAMADLLQDRKLDFFFYAFPSQAINTSANAITKGFLGAWGKGVGRTNIVVFFEGTNDIVISGYNATDTEAHMTTAVNNLRGDNCRVVDGCKIVAVTIIPRGDANATHQGYIATFNAWLKAQVPALIDAVADPTVNAAFDAQADTANSTYYVDGIHLTHVGATTLYPYVTAAIRSVW
ncbi:MAG: SGNH/GDSL hydrolase family protein [Acidobacteriia bacterium]|nr:SGNH/GDSL hydrolase family protein [Terriglobia bacterium]